MQEKYTQQKTNRNQPGADEQQLDQSKEGVVYDAFEACTSFHYQPLSHLLDALHEVLDVAPHRIVQRRTRTILQALGNGLDFSKGRHAFPLRNVQKRAQPSCSLAYQQIGRSFGTAAIRSMAFVNRSNSALNRWESTWAI